MLRPIVRNLKVESDINFCLLPKEGDNCEKTVLAIQLFTTNLPSVSAQIRL